MEPSRQETLEFIQSLDPVTGQPTKHLANRGVTKQLMTAKVAIHEDDLLDEISVDYFEDEGGQYTVFPSVLNERAFYIVSVPANNMHLIEYEGSIYQLDMKARKARPFLNASVSGYDRKRAIQDKNTICWGTAVSVNPAGTKAIFSTNRLALTKQDDNSDRYYEIWFKDLVTGEERFAADGCYQSVLAWDGDVVYLAKHELIQGEVGSVAAKSVVALNLKSGEQQVVLYGIVYCAATYPYVVYTTVDNSLEVLNVQNGTKEIVPGLQYEKYESVISTTGSKYVLVAAVPKRTSHIRDIVIINTEALQARVFSGDDKVVFQRYGFVDANTISLTVMHDNNVEETYIINLQEWR